MYGFWVNTDTQTTMSRNRRLVSGFYYVSLNFISQCLQATTNFEQKYLVLKMWPLFILFHACVMCEGGWGKGRVCVNVCMCVFICVWIHLCVCAHACVCRPRLMCESSSVSLCYICWRKVSQLDLELINLVSLASYVVSGIPSLPAYSGLELWLSHLLFGYRYFNP